MKNTKTNIGSFAQAKMRSILAIIVIAAIIGFSMACGDDNGTTVPVTGVTLNENSISLDIGGTKTITATVSPSNATNKTIGWVSSNPSVATVTYGTVVAVSAGSATIIVTTEDGSKTAYCSVDVNDPSLSILNGNITINPSGPVAVNTELTAAYSGTEAVSFQWKKDGNNIGTASTENPNKYTPTAAGGYSVTVSLTGYNSKTSAPVSVIRGSSVIGSVPDMFPSNWQSYTYEKWTEWMENLDNITEQQIDELINFIIDNYELLSEGGKQFWKRVLPEDTHGIDTDNWPQGYDMNSFYNGMYWRKSDDGLAIAINPMGRGDGINSRPDIFELAEGSGGKFPIGTWVNREDEMLIFTSTTIVFDSPYNYDLQKVNYTMSNNVFTVSNYQTVPYTPTAEDRAKLATYNEANFRSARPWIPATTTIDVKVKRGDWFYTIVDNPVMTPFVSNDVIIGRWLVCDFIDEPNTYNPQNPENPEINFWEGIQFVSNGTIIELRNNAWYNNNSIWTTTTNTYVGLKTTNITTGGIIKRGDTAPEFVIKEYPQGLYLFAQWKAGDYSRDARKPGYYVFKKDAVTDIPVTGVSLNKTSLIMVNGDIETLTAVVAPNTATNKTVTWISNKPGIVTVDGGVVTAVAAGTAVITVRTTDGNKAATCTVKVIDFADLIDTYRTTYLLSNQITIETINISNDLLKISDNYTPGNPDFLNFSITKCEKATTPNDYKNDFPIAFKITGKITGAKPISSTSLYGTSTASGFTESDINTTECWMYLYISYDDVEFEFIRSPFSKADKDNGTAPVNTSSSVNNSLRVYRNY